MEYLRSLWRHVKRIPADAFGVFRRNWAPMITIVALGLAARQAFIWLAIRVSEFSPLVAALLLPLASLSVLFSLIVTLRYIGYDLPALSQTLDDPRSQSPRSQLLTIGGLLIPFLSVYAANGFLKADSSAFVQGTWAEEVSSRLVTIDYTRALIGTEWQLILLVGVALGLRKLIGIFGLGQKNLRWAGTSAYLEALWMITGAVMFAAFTSNIRAWAESRAVVQPLVNARDTITGWIDTITGPFAALYEGALTIVSQIHVVFGLPLAWLMMAVSIYGITLAATREAPEEGATPIPTKNSEITGDADVAGDVEDAGEPGTTDENTLSRRRRLALRMREVAKEESQAAIERTTQPIIGPIKTAWNSLQKLRLAGIGPIIVFCGFFLVAEAGKIGTLYLAREIIGPRPMYMNIGLAPIAETAAYLVYFVLALSLIAAAMELLVRAARSRAGRAGDAPVTTEAPRAD